MKMEYNLKSLLKKMISNFSYLFEFFVLLKNVFSHKIFKIVSLSIYIFSSFDLSSIFYDFTIIFKIYNIQIPHSESSKVRRKRRTFWLIIRIDYHHIRRSINLIRKNNFQRIQSSELFNLAWIISFFDPTLRSTRKYHLFFNMIKLKNMKLRIWKLFFMKVETTSMN